VIVNVVVVDLLILDRSLLGVVNGLQLMTIGEIGVVSGRDDIVLVVSLSG
jgi:phosphoribosylformylglycinamidine (FGAM) synthase-like amidotransferase family enzyme